MNVTFWTDDVESTVRDLKAKGVKITMEPKTADWGTAAAFQDIDGNNFLVGTK
jgi:predicted enzyme related to lactoylglutathione lyase